MTFCRTELAEMGVDPRSIECRTLRRKLKVTQPELAKLAGVHMCTVVRYELGTGRVSARMAERIAAIVERWKVKPPVLEKKPERRGGWMRLRRNRNAEQQVGSDA